METERLKKSVIGQLAGLCPLFFTISILFLFSEPAVRECTHRAVQAQPALAQHAEVFCTQLLSCCDPRKHKIKDCALCIHHASRKPHNGQISFSAVSVFVCQHKHRSRQHRSAVCDDLIRCVSDGERGPVVRVYAHPSCAHYHRRLFRSTHRWHPLPSQVCHRTGYSLILPRCILPAFP